VSFFPQLVAGPIERAGGLIPQLRKMHQVRWDDLRIGGLYIASGLFKKMVIADRLAMIVDPVYQAPENYTGVSIILAAIFFSFQIFCDFSGYSDVAVGAARIFGVKLMENFKHPYLSLNFRSLIRRWHISLTTWFRDYVYFPLGGNKKGVALTVVNGLIVFGISGLWHGAQWTFVVWGILLGIFLGVELLLRPYLLKAIERFGVDTSKAGNRFLQAVWIFMLWTAALHIFRSDSLAVAWDMYLSVFQLDVKTFISSDIEDFGIEMIDLNLSFILILSLLLIQYSGGKERLIGLVINQDLMIRWGIYFIIFVSIYLFGIYGEEVQEFIYFQF
jgi:D-alanyl-lipoteichoic acid acyltransferase DltB (MBOAT superfamily)